MPKKIKIFLADLVHNYLGGGSYMFPLNIGFIAAYAKKIHGDNVEIELFKYPGMLINRLKEEQPDILGLSNYTWSAHLNREVSKLAKSLKPDTMIVFGGPDVNQYPGGYAEFFSIRPEADFYVINEGEVGFSNLVSAYIEKGCDLQAMKKDPIDGCISYVDNSPVIGRTLDRIELDGIPSPYLTGILDKFFDFDLIPVIETNRGCPFKCTYCAQGLVSRHKVRVFDLDRALAELDYIAERVNKTNILCFADANFGILARDVSIAERIRDLQKSKGYPRRCIINWIKTRQSIRLADIMGQAVYLVSSLQSMDPIVLQHIKRKNIDQAHFKEIVDHVNASGGISGTEIILALPAETKQSHINSLKELFTWDVSYIICYNCLLIGGSELTLPEQREKYKIKTAFRLTDSAFGKYGDIMSFECEEGVRSTSTMTEEEVLFFRPVHWLIQFGWNYRCYFELLKFMSQKGLNPVDFFIELIERKDQAPEAARRIIEDFQREARDEWFPTPEALREHFGKKENWEFLTEGGIGKMNGKYTWRVILECKRDWDAHVLKTAQNMLPEQKDIIADLVKFCSESLIDFDADLNNIPSKEISLSSDVMAWRDGKHKGELNPKDVTYVFVYTDEKRNALKVLMEQYKHQNKNVTMRKMSEHMRLTDLFYNIEKA